MTWTPPDPPLTSVWYDPAATRAGVLATLRMEVGDVDVERVDQAIPHAAHLIDVHLDRTTAVPGPPAPAGLQPLLEAAAVNVYHRAGVVASLGGGTGTLPAFEEPYDPLRDLTHELEPFKERWGIA